MAQKRMFSKSITNSEEFLEMPLSSQALYFHLNMNADDDGFVQPKMIMRMVGSNNDDLKLLKTKGFVIPVADRVIVITHWHVNNTIRKDRYSPSIFVEHRKLLGLTDAKSYENLGLPGGNHMETVHGNHESPQVTAKGSRGEDSKEKKRTETATPEKQSSRVTGLDSFPDNKSKQFKDDDFPIEDPLSPEQQELDSLFDDEEKPLNDDGVYFPEYPDNQVPDFVKDGIEQMKKKHGLKDQK